MCRTKKGLTLIELLVILSILALLFSVLIPVLKVSKQKGTSLVCSANLRQLALASQLYSQDYDRYPPGFISTSISPSAPPGGAIGNLVYDWYGWWWFHFISDTLDSDLKQESILGCPDKRKTDRNVLCGNYGVNYSISKMQISSLQDEFHGNPVKVTNIRNPSGVYYLMDSGYALISWKAALENSDLVSFDNPDRLESFYLPGLSTNEDRTITEKQKQDAVEGRHNKSINVAYMDGHTASVKARKWPTYPGDTMEDEPPALSSWRGN